jgi:hypothetical protein
MYYDKKRLSVESVSDESTLNRHIICTILGLEDILEEVSSAPPRP